MISSYVRQGQHTLRRWALDPRVHGGAIGAAHVLAGFCLSAASLEQGLLPLVMGLVWACRGWQAVLAAAGGMVGYGLFWGSAGLQGVIWTGLALAGVLLFGDSRISREYPMLIPATGMLMVSAVGLGFQIFGGDTTSVPLHLIRVALGGATPWLFGRWMQKREPLTAWFCWGFFALSLAQIVPVTWLGLGFVAAGAAAAVQAFPCAALTGLALDLSGVTSVPMTAVTVLSWCVRFLPRYPRWLSQLAPGCMGLLVMYICRQWDVMILPGLFLGGIAGGFFVKTEKTSLRRGETGAAQVRLEMAAGVLEQTRRIVEEIPERGVDEGALVLRAVSEACAGCAARDHCRDVRKMQQLPGNLLRKPLLGAEELPVRCKKGGRVLGELRRAQEQLRSIQADRQRQQEYREAVVQQYRFLGEYLHTLSDELSRRDTAAKAAFDPVVCVWGNRPGNRNADRCAQFAGIRNRYYIILCDGMGTGPGAVKEAKTALTHLQKLLSCGFPAEHALQSLNSICALRDRAASVTVDLMEVELDTGKTAIYKWGAAPSFLITASGTEKLGGASVPPGLAVTDTQQEVCNFLMKRGQILLMVSDGVEESQVLEVCREKTGTSPAELAQKLLQTASRQDDATVVSVQLLYAKP